MTQTQTATDLDNCEASFIEAAKDVASAAEALQHWESRRSEATIRNQVEEADAHIARLQATLTSRLEALIQLRDELDEAASKVGVGTNVGS